MKIKGDFRWLMDAFRTQEGAERVLMKLGRRVAWPMRRPVVDGGTMTIVPNDKRKGGVRRRMTQDNKRTTASVLRRERR